MEENTNKFDNEKITIEVDNTDSVLDWIEKFMKLLKEYGPLKILFGMFMIAFISIFFYFVFNPGKVFEFYEEWAKIRHDSLLELRMDNAPKIQSRLDKLVMMTHASRAMILELHNGDTGNGGLPFSKCTATYEALNLNTYPIADQYQKVNLSLIPFATYLFERGYWCGDTEELQGIDKALYYKMKSNGTEHFAACIIEGIDKPLAFMIISFDTLPNETHDCNTVREAIRHIAMETAVFMEVENRTGKKTKNNGKF